MRKLLLIKIFALLLMGAMLLLTGCDSNPAGSGGPGEATLLITEDIFQLKSMAHGPVASSDSLLVFRLDENLRAAFGEFNDLLVSYGTPSSCDMPLKIYSFEKPGWEVLAPTEPQGFCNMFGGSYGHLLGGKGLKATDCINDSGEIRIQMPMPPDIPKPGYMAQYMLINLVKLNRLYQVTPLFSDTTFYTGLAVSGKNYWIFTDNPSQLLEISRTGAAIKAIDWSGARPRLISGKGEKICMADYENIIHILDTSGTMIGQFDVPFDLIGGLAPAGNYLWVAKSIYISPLYRRYFVKIDIDSSLATGTAVVVETLPVSIDIRALAFDGNNLLAANADSLYVLSSTGEIEKTFSLPVSGVVSMVSTGVILHVMCAGPRGLGASDLVVTRFRLPDPGDI